MKKLTKRTIDALQPRETGPFRAYDDTLPGFFVTVLPSGKKTFGVRYGGRTDRRWMKLGDYGVLTPEDAREAARKVLSEHTLGGDPAADREAAHEMPTFSAWVATYLEHVRRTKKRPEEDERYLAIASKRWGTRKLDDLETRDVEALRAGVGREHTTAANRLLASVAACFSAAIIEGHIKANPAKGLRMYKENAPRDRVLSDVERAALSAAVDVEEDPHARAALFMLLNTGARLSEVLRARWEDLDLASSVPTWRIPSPKSGKPQAVPLPPATCEILRRLERASPFVVAGSAVDEEGNPVPRYDLKGAWGRALKRAKLEKAGIHIHDLRRDLGRRIYREHGLLAAARVLRHRDVRITAAVYAPESMKDLAAAISEREADVIPFPAKRLA